MPNDPSTPPNGTYSSACGADFSTWDGSFTYTGGAIEYTLASNPNTKYSATNQSNGNAIVFRLTVGAQTVQFNGPTFTQQPNGKAKYSGHCEAVGPVLVQDGWTASQTS